LYLGSARLDGYRITGRSSPRCPVATGYRGRRAVVSRTDPRGCKISL